MPDTLNQLERQSEQVLFTCQTIFPFTLFPTYLELTPSRLTVKRMILPFTFSTTPIFIKDIAFVRLSENPFFATLSFEMMGLPEDPKPVRFLHPADAKKMEELIVGCLEAMKSKVKTTDANHPRQILSEIGKNKQI